SFAREQGYRNPQVVETREPAILVDGDGAGHLVIPVRVSHDGSEESTGTDLFVDEASGRVLDAKQIAPNAIVPGVSPNALSNPGFESGPTAWTLNDPGFYSYGDRLASVQDLIQNSTLAHNGSWYAILNGWTTFPPPAGACKITCYFGRRDALGQTVVVPST